MIGDKKDLGYLLHCPNCGDVYAHHKDIEVYERINGEDGQTVILKPGSNAIELSDYNPSLRRNAIDIQFWGECGHFWAIQIIQHKGQTFIKFV